MAKNFETCIRIKVPNCGYINMLNLISTFYKIYLDDSHNSTQLQHNTFAQIVDEDFIHGIQFDNYQIRLSHICDNNLCLTDEIDLSIFYVYKTNHIRIKSAQDIPPIVTKIYKKLVKYLIDFK